MTAHKNYYGYAQRSTSFSFFQPGTHRRHSF